MQKRKEYTTAAVTAMKEEFFLVFLRGFLDETSDPQVQLMVGLQQLHQLASEHGKDLAKKERRLLALERGITEKEPSSTREAVLVQGKLAVAKNTTKHLRNRLDMLHFSIKRRSKEISALAGTLRHFPTEQLSVSV